MEPDKDANQDAGLTFRAASQLSESKNFADLGELVVPANRFLLTKTIEAWNDRVVQEEWAIQMPCDFLSRPALRRGSEVVQNGGSVIIGMSLGNGYFTEANLTRLFRFLKSQNSEIYLLVMDKPSEHNYRALGYSEGQIIQNIKRKSAKIFRALEGALEQADYPVDRFHFVSWDSIRMANAYQTARSALESQYANNETFRKDVRSAVSAYLSSKLKGAAMSEEKHASADQYLLEELAFLTCSQQLLGRNELAYLYHREWPIFELLITGKYDKSLSSNLGFVELKVISLLD